METNYSFQAGARTRSVSTAMPSYAPGQSIRGRSMGPPKKDPLAHLTGVHRQPAMSMDTFFDTVSAEIRKEDAMLKKSSSEKPGNLCGASSSEPPAQPRHRSEGEAMQGTSSGVKGSFTDPVSKKVTASGLQAMMQLKRPMTKAEIFAWKAKNGVTRIPGQSAEGIDACEKGIDSALAAKGLEMDGAGVHPNAVDECAFWSLELNIGTPFGTDQS